MSGHMNTSVELESLLRNYIVQAYNPVWPQMWYFSGWGEDGLGTWTSDKSLSAPLKMTFDEALIERTLLAPCLPSFDLGVACG